MWRSYEISDDRGNQNAASLETNFGQNSGIHRRVKKLAASVEMKKATFQTD